MTAYMQLDDEGYVIQQLGKFNIHDMHGSPPDDPGIYDKLEEFFDWRAPHHPTCKVKKIDGRYQWVDMRSLQAMKDDQWQLIKKERDKVEFGYFTYNGMVFDGDVDAQRRLNGYISISKSALLNNELFSAQFILANNSVVQLSAQDFVNIEQAKVSSVADAFTKGAQLRQMIESAQTKQEIESVVW